MDENNKIKVLTINGWGRSGSTILGSLLGQFDGFFYGGELRNIWNMSLIKNRLCGCSVPFKECSLWRKIFDFAFNGASNVDAEKVTHVMQSTTRMRHIPLKFLPGAKKLFTFRLKYYLDHVRKLFLSIKSVTECKVIVDSSKSVLYSYLLSLIDDLDVYVVHLIRDPRGVAFSKTKEKIQPDSKEIIYMHKFSAFDSSMVWGFRNIATELYWVNNKEKYIMVRYEDFVKEPREIINKILNFTGENPTGSPFLSENEIKLAGSHSVWGNPSRFITGKVKLKLDDTWKKKIKPSHRFLSTFLTFPLLIKYGYKI